MKVLVTGYNGQLGYDVIEELKKHNIQCCGSDKKEFDLTDRVACSSFIKDYKPNIIVHCAAYTNVDKAEKERELCHKINVIGTKNIANISQEIGAKLLYISTDYVFDGKGEKPFTVEDIPNPINYYGWTKYLGELEVKEHLDDYFILRVSWLFGTNGHNFINTIIRLAKVNPNIKVVDDQIGSPTYTRDVAVFIRKLIATNKYGTYHVTNEGFCSWYEFAKKIVELSDMETIVYPIKTIDFKTTARRPNNSRLSKTKLETNGLYILPTWQSALKRYLNEKHSK
ncbi:dTDP-4-dehydrorhamnose reductase [Clostridiaceae bacterium M8S5]|nr:dTDP-4-dehydrorhamnose reductase [Clostridiaceae bacterium M8S5]